MAAQHLSLRVSKRWWVNPAIRAAVLAHRLGLPVNPDRLARVLLDHGYRFTVVSDPATGGARG
jgi:hypothetical protein